MTRTASTRPHRRVHRKLTGGGLKKSFRRIVGYRKSDGSNVIAPNEPGAASASNAPYTPTRDRSHQPVPPRGLRQVSGLDNARHERCLALADEADGITDALYRLRETLRHKGALKKMNTVRKIVGKSLRKLTHYMSMLNCRKYNIAPTEKKLVTKRDKAGSRYYRLDVRGVQTV